MRRLTLTLFIAVVAFTLGAVPASATELVDDDKVQCPTAAHTTIQAGVDAAVANEQVLVCNGTYREQVHIGPTKNGVDVLAKVVRGATIQAPSTPLTAPESLVWIDRASGAKVRRFIIAGPGPGTCNSLLHGVLVEQDVGDAEARVEDNLIKDIRDSTATACDEGIGVRVGRAYANTMGRAFVLRNEIVNYQKAGVVVDGDGSFAQVATNTITGLGPITTFAPTPAQQGVQIGSGTAYANGLEAGADVNSNKISGNQYAVNNSPNPQFDSYGVLVLGTSLAKDPQSTRVTRILSNTVFKNDYGILLFDSANQLVRTNRVFDNGDASTAAGDGGILVAESAPGIGNGNRFESNDARTNVGLDCDDQTTPINTWTGNRGVDANPPGICTP